MPGIDLKEKTPVNMDKRLAPKDEVLDIPVKQMLALPENTMGKVITVLRKLPYESVGDLMEEIKREALLINVPVNNTTNDKKN